MTKDEALKLAFKVLGNCREFIYLTEGPTPPWDEIEQIKECNDALECIAALLKANEDSQPKGQPYHWTADAMQSAINIERENCARLCDAYELPDVAQAIRSRSHQ
jgi:hypothetical protein